MAHEIDYKELIFAKDGLLVVQVKKGFYSIKHHSGNSAFPRCFTSKHTAMTAFDNILPLCDWTKPLEYFEELSDKQQGKFRDLVLKAVGDLKTVDWPNHTDTQ